MMEKSVQYSVQSMITLYDGFLLGVVHIVYGHTAGSIPEFFLPMMIIKHVIEN